MEQQSIDEAMKSQKPDVRRIVGTEGAFGEQMGLSKDWAARAVKAVGNYRDFLRAQRRIAIETRNSPWLKRTVDQWWSSICSTDTIAIRSKSDGAELLFDTVEGDPGEGRSHPPGLYDDARAR